MSSSGRPERNEGNGQRRPERSEGKASNVQNNPLTAFGHQALHSEPPIGAAGVTRVYVDQRMSDLRQSLPSLPCYPCPHAASCCAYGATVSDEEAAAIEANHGPGLVYRTRWGEWRTRVKNKRCALFKDGGCTIHAKSYYPRVCAGFPWLDAETGGRYEYDISICGQFDLSPELVAIHRAIPRSS